MIRRQIGGVWRARAVMAVLAVAIATPAVSRAAPPAVDQGCAVSPAMPTAWASYELDQSFTPRSSTIAAWEVNFLLLGRFDGPVRSRLVFNPAGDATAGPAPTTFAASGIVLAEVTNQIKGPAFRSFWERFELAAPVELVASPLAGSYSIQVLTPLDREFQPYGARLGWLTCGGDYAAGAAYHSLSADGTGQLSRDAFGIEVKFNGEPGTHQPLVRQKHHVGDFQFRTFSG